MIGTKSNCGKEGPGLNPFGPTQVDNQVDTQVDNQVDRLETTRSEMRNIDSRKLWEPTLSEKRYYTKRQIKCYPLAPGAGVHKYSRYSRIPEYLCACVDLVLP